MDQIVLINKQRNRIKVIKIYKSTIKKAKKIIESLYGYLYKKRCKPVLKRSRIETSEEERKKYKEFLDERWKKASIFNYYF